MKYLLCVALSALALGCQPETVYVTLPPTDEDGLKQAGAPCASADECASGYCLELGDGLACAAPCEEGCPVGLVCKHLVARDPDSPLLCVPPTATLCDPCESDLDCGPYGDVCARLGDDEPFSCGIDCSFDGTCPEGFLCTDLLDDAKAFLARQCAPIAGTCVCNDLTAGSTRPCLRTTIGVGVCLGEATCVPGQGFVGCTAAVPALEICDAVDNDCDGDIDESLSGAPLARPCGFGPTPRREECTGLEVCEAGVFGACSRSAPPASELSCDDRDDDCDGAVDEGLLYGPDHCGACGEACPPGKAFDGSTRRECLSEDGFHFCGPIACRVPYFDVDGLEDNGCEVADDHARIGDEVVLPDSWLAAQPFTGMPLSTCADAVVSKTMRIPHDARVHVPQTPPTPSVDYLVLEVVDEACAAATELCFSAEAQPAEESEPVLLEVCWSAAVSDAYSEPSFVNCETLDLRTQHELATAFSNELVGSSELFYVRVRSVGAPYAGSYRIGAFEDVDCPL